MPEPTQLKRLSDASFLDKLLALPANVRLDWKVIARYKHFSLFGLVISSEREMFYKIDTSSVQRWFLSIALFSIPAPVPMTLNFLSLSLMLRTKKFGFGLVKHLRVRPGPNVIKLFFVRNLLIFNFHKKLVFVLGKLSQSSLTNTLA
jgi:hypothetical protein